MVVGPPDLSPDLKAPRFKNVANTPGMTPTALMVWLQNANHPNDAELDDQGPGAPQCGGLYSEPQGLSLAAAPGSAAAGRRGVSG
ncbi:MAG: hypothetical protein WB662_07230, partial [Methyloceanibacter sp.]